MRWPASILFAALGCTFDGTGFGGPPTETAGNITTAPPATSGSTADTESGEPTTDGTVGVSGSGSMTEGGTTTTTTTDPSATATTDPSTTSTTTTTTGPMTTGCAEVPGYVDMDGDGHGDPNKPTTACEGTPGFSTNNIDCNDADPKAWQGSAEVCDGSDNDCDMKVDEYDAASNNAGCDGCDFRVRGSRLYYFCDFNRHWDTGQAYCEQDGLDLAIDNDKPEYDWMLDQIDGWSGLWWIGGHQVGAEFQWINNVEMPPPGDPDSRWVAGEPNDQGLTGFNKPADCVVLRSEYLGGGWLDWNCNADQKFICEGALP